MEKLQFHEFGYECGRRDRARVRLNIPARIMLLGGTFNCVLEDLSCSGARLTTAKPVKLGASGVLTCKEMEAFFTLVWHNTNHCGVVFDRMQPKNTVLGLRWIADNYPRLERQELERMVKEWVSGKAGALPAF